MSSPGITPISAAELMARPAPKEMMLLAGKDGVGKSCGIVSLAALVQSIAPEAVFYVIDTENKFPAALRSFGPDAPSNIVYLKTDNMNMVNEAYDWVEAQHKRGDWLAVESMSRVWERAQDLGYQAITGTSKVSYMDKRRKIKGDNKPPVTPRPDELWSITKGAHDVEFLDRMSASETLNVVLSTTISRPKQQGVVKESADRRAVREEFGIDLGLDGAPRLPYYVQTLILFEKKAGIVSCRVLRDSLSLLDNPAIEFDVTDKKQFGLAFWSQAR